MNLEDFPDNKIRSDGRGLVIASIVMLLAAVESAIVSMSEWPYMKQIDNEATIEFFGYATAISKFFHALSAFFFTYYCHAYQSYQTPLIVGRIVAFIACILYLCVEMFGSRRYVMTVCYSLFRIASGSSAVLRGYVAEISSQEDRPKAYSGLNAATMVSIIIAPLVQEMFHSIHYPGYEMYPNVKFHIYSAPIWIATATNIGSVILVKCHLNELPRRAQLENARLTLSSPKLFIRKVLGLNLNWKFLALCWIQKMVFTLSSETLLTLISVILMTSYGWTGSEAVSHIAVAMVAVGVLAVGVTCLYVFYGLGKLFPQRFVYLLGLMIILSMYLFTYPWSSTSNPVSAYNSTAKTGCNPESYEWCSYSKAPFSSFLLTVVAFVMGIGLPLSSISLDAIYSKMLGSVDQKVLQGAMVIAEDVVMIIGPIYAARVYTHFGFEKLWTWNGLITAAGAVLWISQNRKFSVY